MAAKKKPKYVQPRCAHCGKTAADPHYFSYPRIGTRKVRQLVEQPISFQITR
jgi:hypothetical protein